VEGGPCSLGVIQRLGIEHIPQGSAPDDGQKCSAASSSPAMAGALAVMIERLTGPMVWGVWPARLLN